MVKLKKSKSKKNNLSWLPNYTGCVLNQLQNEESLKKLNESSFSELWEYRPTRLFWVYSDFPCSEEEDGERNRFYQSLKKNYYDKKYLLEFFKNDPEITEVIENNTKPASGVVFPCVLKGNTNKQLPSVSFSSFIVAQKAVDYNLDNVARIVKESLELDTNQQYIPEISLYLELDGKSYELAFASFLIIEHYKDLFQRIPSICCSGIINQNGEINKIDCAKEKLEAASKMGYDYIVLPESNRNDVSATENTIFIQNIFELKNWLLDLIHKDEQKIIHWLKAGGKEPTREEFNNYFKINNYISFIYQWKKNLYYVPDNIAIKRLLSIVMAYNVYLTENDSNPISINKLKLLKEFTPKNVYYSIAAYLIASKGLSERVCDWLNQELSEAIKIQGPDWALAAKQLKETDFIEILANNRTLRERYPHLICYYFKNPPELLYLLSSIKELTAKESNLIDRIHKTTTQPDNDDSMISLAYSVLNNSNEQLLFDLYSEKGTFSDQLAVLYMALRKLDTNHNPQLRKAAEKQADEIINTTVMLNKFEKKHISNLLINNSEITELTNDICNKHALKKLLKVAKEEANPCIPLHNNSNNKNHISIKKVLNKIIGFSCNPSEINVLKIINNSNIYKSEMYAFIREAISYFTGKNNRNSKAFKFHYFKGAELAEEIGLLASSQQLKKEEYDCFNALWENNKFSFRPLMWLYFLDAKCKKYILPQLQNFLMIKKNQLQEKSENGNCNTQKMLCELEFVAALFDIKELCIEFECVANKAFDEKTSLTRTEQLLVPIYLYLKKNYSIPELSKIGNYLNNSNLVLEIIKRFGNSLNNIDTLFVKNEKLSDIDQRILTNLTIDYLQNQKEVLRRFALTYISSLPELQRAINSLKQKGSLSD